VADLKYLYTHVLGRRVKFSFDHYGRFVDANETFACAEGYDDPADVRGWPAIELMLPHNLDGTLTASAQEDADRLHAAAQSAHEDPGRHVPASGWSQAIRGLARMYLEGDMVYRPSSQTTAVEATVTAVEPVVFPDLEPIEQQSLDQVLSLAQENDNVREAARDAVREELERQQHERNANHNLPGTDKVPWKWGWPADFLEKLTRIFDSPKYEMRPPTKTEALEDLRVLEDEAEPAAMGTLNGALKRLAEWQGHSREKYAQTLHRVWEEWASEQSGTA